VLFGIGHEVGPDLFITIPVFGLISIFARPVVPNSLIGLDIAVEEAALPRRVTFAQNLRGFSPSGRR